MCIKNNLYTIADTYAALGKDSDVLVGVLLGVMGVAAIIKLLEKNCPCCDNIMGRGQSHCLRCGTVS